MSKKDLPTFSYKIFIIALILFQFYLLVFRVINNFTILMNGIIFLYFIFRYYLLYKLSKRATKMSLTLPELVNKKVIKCSTCKNCSYKT